MTKKVFSRKYSKIITMNTLLKATNETSNSNDKLMIHTANGLYIGKLRPQVDYENLELQEGDDILTAFNKTYLSSLEKYQASNEAKNIPEIDENPASITLEDVQLLTSGRIINMPSVEIFVDHIVGFSMGSLEQ